MTTAISCTKPYVKPITTSMSFFAIPFCVCKCHLWVKLCAEQLCGFCTSRSRIGCGKLPLQLVISLFAMPPLYLYIIIPFTRIESKIAQWQNQSAKLATTKHITHLTMQKTHMHGAKESHNSIHGMKPPVLTVGSERASQSKTVSRKTI